MTAALEGCEWSAARPGRTLPPGKTRYPLYRRLGGPQGRSGRAQNLVPTGIRSRTVQPVVSIYIYIYVCVCVYTYTYIHTYTHTHKHKHTHKHHYTDCPESLLTLMSVVFSDCVTLYCVTLYCVTLYCVTLYSHPSGCLCRAAHSKYRVFIPDPLDADRSS